MSPIPIVDISSPLIKELELRSIRRAALFGTGFVMLSTMFEFVPNVALVQPLQAEIESIHITYMELLENGEEH